MMSFSIKGIQVNFTSGPDIEYWLNQLKLMQMMRECEAPRFLKPFHLATLAHILRQEGVGALALPKKVGDYADTMQLWDALEITSPFGPKNRQAAGRYYPIQLLRDETLIEESADALKELFQSVCDSPETLDGVHTMLRELIGNCFAHSAVKDGLYGVICAQVWQGGRKAQIALCDSGIGIRASLSENALLLEKLQHSNSCDLATEYGITSKPGKGHSGYGLAVARGLLQQNLGMLYVRSGNEVFRVCRGRASSATVADQWAGTLLVIEWDLDNPVDISALYDSFPLPEGADDDDFDF
ncbi:ATP-binding protein [[Empedobacter] haloabium]|uniref:ATP-binding protein n=1 Tax=[Empedobacter] haloabium TaxID=592317 RepID=A0ABZ1UPQ4_9BURK